MDKKEYPDFDITTMFESGKIFDVNDNALLQVLNQICTEGIPNETVRHRAIIRGITVNHILMKRHIDSLNKINRKTQLLLIILTVALLATSSIQILPALLR